MPETAPELSFKASVPVTPASGKVTSHVPVTVGAGGAVTGGLDGAVGELDPQAAEAATATMQMILMSQGRLGAMASILGG